MDWITGIQRALDYIEAHLTQEIDYDTLAKEACSSSYHFQRVFSLLCGYTLGEYIRLRRLTLAGAELAAGKIRVIDAALKYGYDSPDSFARAFTRFHGVTPSSARGEGVRLNTFTRLSIKLSLEGGCSMDYRMENHPGMTLIGYRRRFTGVPHGPQRIKQEEELFTTTRGYQWMLRGASGSYPQGDPVYVGVVDQVTDEGYDFLVAVPMDKWEMDHLWDPSVTGIDFMDRFGFEKIVIPPGTYAVFETDKMKYPMEASGDLREQIAAQWLPASGYVLRDAPELEIVHWFLAPRRTDRFVELWLPVEKQG